MPDADTLAQLADRRRDLRERFVKPAAERPPSTGRGVHHLALICSDPEMTIMFYADLLGFPLVELFENRDYPGSTHFFFDIGHENMLAFFDFPGLGLEPVPEGLGGVQHVAISVTPRAVRGGQGAPRGRGRLLPRSRPRGRGVDLLQGPGQHPGRADPPAAVRDAGVGSRGELSRGPAQAVMSLIF